MPSITTWSRLEPRMLAAANVDVGLAARIARPALAAGPAVAGRRVPGRGRRHADRGALAWPA